MDFYSFSIGFGGLIVAIVTTVLAYKQRTATLRDRVFERQVEATTEVLSATLSTLPFGRFSEPRTFVSDRISRVAMLRNSKLTK
jgi:hypothetical protein